MNLVHGLLTSDPGVYATQLCTAGVDQHSGLFIYIREIGGGSTRQCVGQYKDCFVAISWGATLRRRAGYTLGFAMHFQFVSDVQMRYSFISIIGRAR